MWEVFPAEVLEHLAVTCCEGTFLTRLAVHTNSSIEQVADLYSRLDPSLRQLAQSPMGWAVLSNVMTEPGSAPIMPAVH